MSRNSISPPKPVFTYQGAHLAVYMQIGPFSIPDHGYGHGVSFGDIGGVPQVIVRPQMLALPRNPPTNQVVMGYEQAGTEWEMVFRVTTDPQGGLVGGSFELGVDSNYPQTPMGIAKTEINQPAFGALVHHTLPADYRAQMTLSYWANGQLEPPLDAWVMIEIGYIPDDARGKKQTPIPMVPLGTAVLFPAHQESKGGVLGNNYPRQVRAATQR